MKNAVVFANDIGNIAELTAEARKYAEQVTLVSCADCFGCADKVIAYAAEQSAAVELVSIVQAILQEGPELVLCESGRDGKLVAGYLAGKLGTSPLCDIGSLKVSDEGVEITRLVYGGSAVKTESCSLPAVMTVPSGTFEPGNAAEAVKEEMAAFPWAGVELTGTDALETSSVNLAAAKRVIGAGRGLGSADNIPAFEKLASLLNAEIGCTRPAAEEEHWYTKDRYIGVSGVMLKPSFYMAVGISGQIQHMVGVNQAGVIFAIDKNENAPIVSQSDYVLVGDINNVLPLLIEKLS